MQRVPNYQRMPSAEKAKKMDRRRDPGTGKLFFKGLFERCDTDKSLIHMKQEVDSIGGVGIKWTRFDHQLVYISQFLTSIEASDSLLIEIYTCISSFNSKSVTWQTRTCYDRDTFPGMSKHFIKQVLLICMHAFPFKTAT